MGSSGITRAAGVLLILIAVMLVLIAIPGYKVFCYRAEKTGCDQAIKSAEDGLIIEYLYSFKEGSVEKARSTLDDVMPARPGICPAGGTVYLLRDNRGIYTVVCGLHGSDKKQRVRLNASRAMELLAEARQKAKGTVQKNSDSVEIELNGRRLECVRVSDQLDIRRGTATTNGYDGVVCFYGLEGDGVFNTGKAEEGEICYFVYADENYAAVWRADDGWTGDAYKGI